jgi:hypothetical protein
MTTEQRKAEKILTKVMKNDIGLLLEDERLSFMAKGMFLYLLQTEKKEIISMDSLIEELRKHGNKRYTEIYDGLLELKKYEYIVENRNVYKVSFPTV